MTTPTQTPVPTPFTDQHEYELEGYIVVSSDKVRELEKLLIVETQALTTERTASQSLAQQLQNLQQFSDDQVNAKLGMEQRVAELEGGLTSILEAWDSEIIQGRLAYLAIRRGGSDGTDEERAWIKDRIDKARSALSAPLTVSPETQAKQCLDRLTDEQRMEVFWRYCRYCGRIQPEDGLRCQCGNDE